MSHELRDTPNSMAKMTLSQAIRKGASMVKPARDNFFSFGKCCAIGSALVAHYGSYRDAVNNKWERSKGDGIIGSTSRLFDVPPEVVQEASDRFEQGDSRLTVAAWLRKKGY